MKKVLLILCACAVILSFAACKKNTETVADDTADAVETSDVINNDPVDSDDAVDNVTEDNADTTDNSSATDDTTGVVSDTVKPDDSAEPDETTEPLETDEVVDTTESKDTEKDTEKETPKPKDTESPVVDMGVDTYEVITPGGTEPDLWPSDSIPEDVPAYEDYSEMYSVTYDDNESSEEWYLSFDSTEDDFDEYLAKLEEAGYQESEKIVGFWGNGEQILNIFTEEVDGEFCVSIDIFKSKPVEYPDAVSAVFPEFTVSDSTLYGWYVTEEEDCNILSVSYACGKDFVFDLNAYKNKLIEAGFTVTDDEATIEKDGKTYTVRYGDNLNRYEDCLEYVF